MERRSRQPRIGPLVTALALAASCAAALGQQTRTQSYQTADGLRTAVVTDFSQGRPAPVVVVLHGVPGTSEQIRRYMAWDEIAAREGLVIVYPQGIGQSWNDGRPADARRFNPASRADDVAFIRRIVSELDRQAKADGRRVFVMGFSGGGHMAFRLACEASGLFAGAAAVAANLSVIWRRSCPGRPMPMLMMAGTADSLSPWEGRASAADPDGALLSAPDGFAFFRARNGCTGVGERALPKQGAADDTRIVLLDGTGCRFAVQLYRVEGGGHHAPARANRPIQPLVGAMLGRQNHDVEAAEEIWAFFSGKARP